MDDLISKMQEILSTEEGRAQLNSLASALGMSGETQGDNQNFNAQSSGDSGANNSGTGGFDISQLAAMLGQNGAGTQNNNTAANNTSGGFDLSALSGLLGGNDGSGINLGALAGIQQMIGALGKNDDINSNLLLALRPHFSDERKTKIDQAVKMLKLLAILPLLKDSGILGGLL